MVYHDFLFCFMYTCIATSDVDKQ